MRKDDKQIHTVNIGNYIDEKKNDILKEVSVDLEEEKNYESERHLFSLLQFLRIILAFF